MRGLLDIVSLLAPEGGTDATGPVSQFQVVTKV